MNPNDPVQPIQPQPAPQQPVVPAQPVPAAPVQPQVPAAPTAVGGIPPQKSGKLKKILIIGGIIFGVLLVLGVTAAVIFALLGGGVPKYTETKQMELAGYTATNANSGMRFDYPAEMKDKIKTDLQTELYDYLNDDKESDGWYGTVVGDIQTLPFTTLNDTNKKALADAFNSGKFDDSITGGTVGGIKNVKVTNKTISNDNAQFQADLSMEVESTDGKFTPGKGTMILYLKDRYIYTFAYMFPNEVYDKNEAFIKSMQDSVEVGI
jgi:ABC-type antimicrobial peptide transport system permease subunit